MNILGHHVCVDFGGFNIGMTHQLLNDTNLDSVFQQMGGTMENFPLISAVTFEKNVFINRTMPVRENKEIIIE